MLTGCRTCPEKNPEVIKTLDPASFPGLIDISFATGDDKEALLLYFADIYSEHLKLLIAAKSTGKFIDDIDDEIEYCRDVLAWLEGFGLKPETE